MWSTVTSLPVSGEGTHLCNYVLERNYTWCTITSLPVGGEGIHLRNHTKCESARSISLSITSAMRPIGLARWLEQMYSPLLLRFLPSGDTHMYTCMSTNTTCQQTQMYVCMSKQTVDCHAALHLCRPTFAKTAGHVPPTSAGHVPPPSAGHVPCTFAGHMPCTSAGHVPCTSAGHMPHTSAGHVPSTSAVSRVEGILWRTDYCSK